MRARARVVQRQRERSRWRCEGSAHQDLGWPAGRSTGCSKRKVTMEAYLGDMDKEYLRRFYQATYQGKEVS